MLETASVERIVLTSGCSNLEASFPAFLRSSNSLYGGALSFDLLQTLAPLPIINSFRNCHVNVKVSLSIFEYLKVFRNVTTLALEHTAELQTHQIRLETA